MKRTGGKGKKGRKSKGFVVEFEGRGWKSGSRGENWYWISTWGKKGCRNGWRMKGERS